MTAMTKFPSPYDLTAPPVAEDWRSLYPYYLQFKDTLCKV